MHCAAWNVTLARAGARDAKLRAPAANNRSVAIAAAVIALVLGVAVALFLAYPPKWAVATTSLWRRKRV